jgi:CcmD family protein
MSWVIAAFAVTGVVLVAYAVRLRMRIAELRSADRQRS